MVDINSAESEVLAVRRPKSIWVLYIIAIVVAIGSFIDCITWPVYRIQNGQYTVYFLLAKYFIFFLFSSLVVIYIHKRSQFGWKLCIIFSIACALNCLYGVLNIPIDGPDFSTPTNFSQRVGYATGKVIQFVIFTVIVLRLFKDHVKQYFRVNN
jgi:peptidoglycan/LPS O-acetylase OafA/YrhL